MPDRPLTCRVRSVLAPKTHGGLLPSKLTKRLRFAKTNSNHWPRAHHAARHEVPFPQPKQQLDLYFRYRPWRCRDSGKSLSLQPLGRF